MELQKKGWILSESALKSNESNLSIKKLLDRDLREVGAGVSDLAKGKFESIEHEKIILQVMKVRNISAPKANELSKVAPKLLKLSLTDGVNNLSAIEIEPTELNLDTKPGTKIAVKVKQMKMSNGQLLFTPKNVEIQGGEVEALVSKWELSKSLAGIKGSRTTGGPPPFIPFGQRIEQNLPNDKGFRSLQAAKQKESDADDSEFKAQRQDAIAEAQKGTKKVFGGGSKQLVDGNVQKIIDKGYTEEQAVTALKYTRNNVDKALSNLKRREENQKRAHDYEPREKRSGKGSKSDNAETVASKPSANVSLFSFLADKIPTTTENTAKEIHSERFENNISSSFRKHDKENTNKSQHWPSNEQHKSSHNRNSSYNNINNSSKDNPREREFRGGSTSGGNNQKDSKFYSSNSNYSNYHSKSSNYQQQNQSSNHYQQQKPSSSGNTSSSYNNNNSSSNSNHNSSKKFENKYEGGKYEKYEKFDKYDKFHKPEYCNKQSNYQSQQNNSFNKSRNTNSSSGKYYNDSHQGGNSSSRNVVDSMEKMTIRGNSSCHQQPLMNNPQTNYQPSAPLNEQVSKHHQQQKPFVKPGSYPIVGFKNKETNEHAKNALKTKTIPGVVSQNTPKIHQNHHNQSANWQQQPNPNQPPPQMPHPMPMKTQPPAPFNNSAGVVQQSMSQTLPQPFVPQPSMIPHPIPTAVFPTSMPAYPAPIIMQSVPGISTQNQVTQQAQTHAGLNIGDSCMAKYWEDGQYYNAKITNVSDSTYVVLFYDYGNAEEVRKSDVLPLIAACPTPPHSATFVTTPQPTQAYHVSQQQQKMPQHHQQPNYHQSSYNKNHSGGMKNHQRR